MAKTKFFFTLAVVGSLCVYSYAHAEDHAAASDLSVEKIMGALFGGADDAPEWLDRTDFSINILGSAKPSWEIETIQPLHENENNTFFWQGRLAHRDDDQTLNLGAGYRYILDDKSWMFGANGFYDRTVDESHERVGLGLEAFHSYATFRGNYYNALSGTKTVNIVNGVSETERAVDGWDVSVETPVPYISWATLNVKGYEWDGHDLSDSQGYNVGLRMHPFNNMEIEAGYQNDDDDARSFVNLTWYYGRPAYIQHSIASDGFLSSTMITKRDLEKHRLEKVRRENDIVLEKRRVGGAGIVVGRGT